MAKTPMVNVGFMEGEYTAMPATDRPRRNRRKLGSPTNCPCPRDWRIRVYAQEWLRADLKVAQSASIVAHRDFRATIEGATWHGMWPEEHLRAIEEVLREHPEGMTASQIETALTTAPPRRTLQYRLKSLVDNKRLIMVGTGRWARYRMPRLIQGGGSWGRGSPGTARCADRTPAGAVEGRRGDPGVCPEAAGGAPPGRL